MLKIEETLKDAILKNVSSFELRRIAIENGMKTLRDSGMEKVKRGLTTIEEVISVS